MMPLEGAQKFFPAGFRGTGFAFWSEDGAPAFGSNRFLRFTLFPTLGRSDFEA